MLQWRGPEAGQRVHQPLCYPETIVALVGSVPSSASCTLPTPRALSEMLFGTQSHHGIDPRSSESRYVARQQRDYCEQNNRRGKSGQIDGPHLK